jgi:hypothetical protein
MKKLALLIIAVMLQTTIVVGQDCVVCSQPPTVPGASVIGTNSIAQGVGSTAIGTHSYTESQAGNSIAIGTWAKTVASLSVVIGSGRDSYNMLVNNMQQSLMVGFGSKYPSLFVGRSPFADKTGKIAIGNVVNQNGQMDPLTKLHLRADEGEEASFFIEPNSWSGGDFANLFLGNFYHGITADTNQGLHFLSQKNYLFGAGNVGLGVEEPKAKLHVDGDILFESAMQGFVMKSEDGHCWKGIISNTGILEFQQVDCTTFTMAEETPETEHNGVFVYPNPSNGSFVVEYTGNKNELRLEVTSVNGALLGTYPIQKGKNTIALPEISQQLVVVTAYTTRGKLVSAHKIMVSR